jgi:hypothetical protein
MSLSFITHPLLFTKPIPFPILLSFFLKKPILFFFNSLLSILDSSHAYTTEHSIGKEEGDFE